MWERGADRKRNQCGLNGRKFTQVSIEEPRG